MGTEDKQVAIRMFLMLIISVVLGVIVLAFGAFFALTNAMQDRDITLAGLYFGTGLEVVT
jgi:vacuolar-type H+-ATPase subunit I/STV1